MNPAIPFISQLPLPQQKQWIKALAELMPSERILLAEEIPIAEKRDCTIAIVANPKPSELKEFSNLQWVQSLWAGIENLIQPSIEQDFKLVRLIDPMLTETMAEAVLAWSLYIHRKMPTYLEQQKKKIWLEHSYTPPSQCKIGILGLGELGQASAKRLVANGFQVMGWSQSKKEIPDIQSFSGQEELLEMLKSTNILVCLLPLTQRTKGLIDQELLTHLPSDASLINFARGGLINTNDLISVLDKGGLYHAVLDVFEKEPLPLDNPLWDHKRITLLPHISAMSNPDTAVKIVAKNINDYRQAGRLTSLVDLSQGY